MRPRPSLAFLLLLLATPFSSAQGSAVTQEAAAPEPTFRILSHLGAKTMVLAAKDDGKSLHLVEADTRNHAHQLWVQEPSSAVPGTYFLRNVGASTAAKFAMVLQMNGPQDRGDATLAFKDESKVWQRWIWQQGDSVRIATADPNHEQYLNVLRNDSNRIGTHDSDGANARWSFVPAVSVGGLATHYFYGADEPHSMLWAGEPISVQVPGLPRDATCFVAVVEEDAVIDKSTLNGNSLDDRFWRQVRRNAGGVAEHTIRFPGKTKAGSYEVRLFIQLNRETPTASSVFSFDVLPRPSFTAKEAYVAGGRVSVSFDLAGLPGGAQDALVLTKKDGTKIETILTGGKERSSVTFQSTLPAGDYEAKLVLDPSALIPAPGSPASRHEFKVVSVPALSTQRSVYQEGDDVTVDFDFLPGKPDDRIVVALKSAPASEAGEERATGGKVKSSVAFKRLPPGVYVARFIEGGARSSVGAECSFTVVERPFIDTDQSRYVSGTPIVVEFRGLPGGVADTITITAQGAQGSDDPLAQKLTKRRKAGEVEFGLLALKPGFYEARFYPDYTPGINIPEPSAVCTFQVK